MRSASTGEMRKKAASKRSTSDEEAAVLGETGAPQAVGIGRAIAVEGNSPVRSSPASSLSMKIAGSSAPGSRAAMPTMAMLMRPDSLREGAARTTENGCAATARRGCVSVSRCARLGSPSGSRARRCARIRRRSAGETVTPRRSPIRAAKRVSEIESKPSS